MADFKDVSEKGDQSVLLKIVSKGKDGPSPGDLALCKVHCKFVKDTKSGPKVKGGSKHIRELVPKRTYKLPCILFDVEYSDMKFTNVENASAEPTQFVCGDGDAPDCLDLAVRRLGEGGSAVLKLKDGALPAGRPQGELTVEVELVSWEEPCMGPGDVGWAGMRSVVAERMKGETFLQSCEEAAGQLEAIYKLRTDWSVEEKDEISAREKEVKKLATAAVRRFSRAGKWAESGAVKADGIDKEKLVSLVGFAKAELINHKQFVPGAPAKKSLALLLARSTALKAVQLAPTDAVAQAVAGSVYAELGDFAKAREYIDAALQIDPTLPGPKSDLARMRTKEKEEVQSGAEKTFLGQKAQLDGVVAKGDAAGIKSLMDQIKSLLDEDKVTWDVFLKSKVGKTVGDLKKKPPNPEIAKIASDFHGELVRFADKKCRQVI